MIFVYTTSWVLPMELKSGKKKIKYRAFFFKFQMRKHIIHKDFWWQQCSQKTLHPTQNIALPTLFCCMKNKELLLISPISLHHFTFWYPVCLSRRGCQKVQLFHRYNYATAPCYCFSISLVKIVCLKIQFYSKFKCEKHIA